MNIKWAIIKAEQEVRVLNLYNVILGAKQELVLVFYIRR